MVALLTRSSPRADDFVYSHFYHTTPPKDNVKDFPSRGWRARGVGKVKIPLEAGESNSRF